MSLRCVLRACVLLVVSGHIDCGSIHSGGPVHDAASQQVRSEIHDSSQHSVNCVNPPCGESSGDASGRSYNGTSESEGLLDSIMSYAFSKVLDEEPVRFNLYPGFDVNIARSDKSSRALEVSLQSSEGRESYNMEERRRKRKRMGIMGMLMSGSMLLQALTPIGMLIGGLFSLKGMMFQFGNFLLQAYMVFRMVTQKKQNVQPVVLTANQDWVSGGSPQFIHHKSENHVGYGAPILDADSSEFRPYKTFQEPYVLVASKPKYTYPDNTPRQQTRRR